MMDNEQTQNADAVRPDKPVRPIAYLYHDANTPADAHPWLHSTMLVLAADRRPGLRGETPLVTMAQAEAMVAAERERCAKLCEWLPIGTGLEGKTFSEAIRGEGIGGKMADGFVA